MDIGVENNLLAIIILVGMGILFSRVSRKLSFKFENTLNNFKKIFKHI